MIFQFWSNTVYRRYTGFLSFVLMTLPWPRTSLIFWFERPCFFFFNLITLIVVTQCPARKHLSCYIWLPEIQKKHWIYLVSSSVGCWWRDHIQQQLETDRSSVGSFNIRERCQQSRVCATVSFKLVFRASTSDVNPCSFIKSTFSPLSGLVASSAVEVYEIKIKEKIFCQSQDSIKNLLSPSTIYFFKIL